MNRTKRKDINNLLNSGRSLNNISFCIGQLLNQPEQEISRIIQNLEWDIKHILTAFDNFPESKTNKRYHSFGVEVL